MKKTALILTSTCLSMCASASLLTMAGSADIREASVWAKLDNPSEGVSAKFFAAKNPDKKFEAKIVQLGDKYNPEIVKIVLENLSPATEYVYEVSNGGQKSTGQIKTQADYKTRTPPPDFTFVALGANHINDKIFDEAFREPGGEYEIFEAVKNTKPAFALWVGALNNYRNADTGSRSAITSRLAELRALAQARPLLNSQPNYGVFGANVLSDASSKSAANHSKVFDIFWCNPENAVGNARAYSFSYADADFFVLDDFSNSSNLDYKSARPKMLGDEQLEWLFTAIQNSKATFKFIVMNTPVFNPVENGKNFTHAEQERKRLLNFLSDKKIEGIIAISGKKDYGEVTRFIRAGSYPVTEVTAGPLTARAAKEVSEMNYFRVPSSSTLCRSFVQIKIEGAEGSRAATITFFNSKGEAGFSTTIRESDLKKFD